MRKIKNVEDALILFESNVDIIHECSKSGNYRKGNRAYDHVETIVKYLLENNALDLLKQLYEDPNLWVRLAAAIVMAPWDEINAFNIVKGIKEMDVDMYSFAAKYTLLNWKELSSSNKKCDL